MHKRLTTNQGTPVGDNQNSRTAGSRGPTLLEDYHLLEKLAHFDRERVPERVVHARGAGAHGIFKVINSMSNYTKASFLQEVGKVTPVFVRFSTVIHSAGSPETARDPRGFATKFYTEEGNYDLVGNHLPVFFIRDAMKFPDMVHSLKPAPDTNIQDPNRYWDFMTLSPESTHMLTWVFSDYGTPATYRQMQGFGVHTFVWVNNENNRFYVKYHWKTKQGIKNLNAEEVKEVQGTDFNHATRDLFDHINNGNHPEWELYVQLLPVEEEVSFMERFEYDPLDPTKVWSEEIYPLQLVGHMTLNQNPKNFFAEVEQSAFSPSALVPGIEPSADKLLQGRLFSYPDTQRHRIGPNYLQLPINCPYATKVNNYQVDGNMQTRTDISTINYEPNRYDDLPKETPEYVESEDSLSGKITRQTIAKTLNFRQAGELYRSFSEDERKRLIQNLVKDLKQVNSRTQLLAICNFYRADKEYGTVLAKELGLDIGPYLDQIK